MYAMDLPRHQFDRCESCLSDLEVPTSPPPRLFSRQLLGYLFEVRLDDVDPEQLLALKTLVCAQLRGQDLNKEILRKIAHMFPFLVRVPGRASLSPMFLRLLRDRLVILLNMHARRRARRPLKPMPTMLERSVTGVMSILPMMITMLKEWLVGILEAAHPRPEILSDSDTDLE